MCQLHGGDSGVGRLRHRLLVCGGCSVLSVDLPLPWLTSYPTPQVSLCFPHDPAIGISSYFNIALL